MGAPQHRLAVGGTEKRRDVFLLSGVFRGVDGSGEMGAARHQIWQELPGWLGKGRTEGGRDGVGFGNKGRCEGGSGVGKD